MAMSTLAIKSEEFQQELQLEFIFGEIENEFCADDFMRAELETLCAWWCEFNLPNTQWEINEFTYWLAN